MAVLDPTSFSKVAGIGKSLKDKGSKRIIFLCFFLFFFFLFFASAAELKEI